MYCYDCSLDGHPKPAIGICVACGAAVCVECAEVGTQTIHRLEGFVPADHSDIETRVVNCAQCAAAVHAHHPAELGLTRQMS